MCHRILRSRVVDKSDKASTLSEVLCEAMECLKDDNVPRWWSSVCFRSVLFYVGYFDADLTKITHGAT